jgi:hypothetical protein
VSLVNIKLTVDQVERLADRFDGLTARGELALVAVDAVNAVAVAADRSIRHGENEGLNLSDADVQSRTLLSLATTTPRAEMLTRGKSVRMGEYPFTQQWTSAKTQAKGDPSRGIPAGSKAAGVKVDMKSGDSAHSSHWFLLTSAKTGQTNVFYRNRENYEFRIGPSPYQLARFQIALQQDSIAEALNAEALARMSKRIEGALQ